MRGDRWDNIDLKGQVDEVLDEENNVVAVQVPMSVWESVQEVVPLSQRALYGHRVRPQLKRALDKLREVCS